MMLPVRAVIHVFNLTFNAGMVQIKIQLDVLMGFWFLWLRLTVI